jgi:excisionase family DNA binding protein
MSALTRTSGQVTTEWISIREASALVGVSVATLRRWCDAGHVPVFTTPGGHRRFAREAVMRLLPVERETGSLSAATTTTMSIVRGYRRASHHTLELPEALANMTSDERSELRQHGRSMVAALVDALDARAHDEAAHCARARASAAACGRMVGETGLTLQEALSVFVRFRAPFLHELGVVCRRRGLDSSAATALLERASSMLDGLLPAVVAGFDGAAAAR